MTSPSGEWACGCLHDPLTPVWKYSLLQVLLAHQFQKGLDALPSQCPASTVWSSFLIVLQPTVTRIFIDFCGLGEPGIDEIPFHSKEVVPRDALGSPFGNTWGSHMGPLRMAKWESACLLPSRPRGKDHWCVRTCWDAKRREWLFRATATPQHEVAHFQDWSSSGMQTCTLFWHVITA